MFYSVALLHQAQYTHPVFVVFGFFYKFSLQCFPLVVFKFSQNDFEFFIFAAVQMRTSYIN